MDRPLTIVPPAAIDSLRLYASWGCPFSHRVLAALAVTGLQAAIPVVWMRDIKREAGWEIDGHEPMIGAKNMPELYKQIDSNGTGRPSVPLLVDLQTRQIVSTESRDIVRFVTSGLGGACELQTDFCPPDAHDEIDELNLWINEHITRGVYRAGLANSQALYERECRLIFDALDQMEARLSRSNYLTGDKMTEADLFLFPTLVRFDAIYLPLFRCSIRRISDYPALSSYLARMIANPCLGDSFNIDRAKQHYFRSIIHRPNGAFEPNPSGIVPL